MIIIDEDRVLVVLACGHWIQPVPSASSAEVQQWLAALRERYPDGRAGITWACPEHGPVSGDVLTSWDIIETEHAPQ